MAETRTKAKTKTKTKTKTETAIVNEIRVRCSTMGGKCYKLHGSQYSHVGAPDLIGYCLETPFVCEVKKSGKFASPAQRYELHQWRKIGVLAFVAHSADEFEQNLRSFSETIGEKLMPPDGA